MKTRIAAATTILGLAGLAGVAVNAGRHQASPTLAAKPLVRTKVIRRTVHVTKHAKPRHPGAAVIAVATQPSYPAPVTSSSGATAVPVTTSSSGGGGGGGEDEREYESEAVQEESEGADD